MSFFAFLPFYPQTRELCAAADELSGWSFCSIFLFPVSKSSGAGQAGGRIPRAVPRASRCQLCVPGPHCSCFAFPPLCYFCLVTQCKSSTDQPQSFFFSPLASCSASQKALRHRLLPLLAFSHLSGHEMIEIGNGTVDGRTRQTIFC